MAQKSCSSREKRPPCRFQGVSVVVRGKIHPCWGFQKTPPPAPTPHPCHQCSTASPRMFHATAFTRQTTPRLGTRSDPRFANRRGTSKTSPAPFEEVRNSHLNRVCHLLALVSLVVTRKERLPRSRNLSRTPRSKVKPHSRRTQSA